MAAKKASTRLPMILGSAKYTRKIWIRSGVPRIKSTYTLPSQRKTLTSDSRASATMIPISIPKKTLSAVISTVIPAPAINSGIAFFINSIFMSIRQILLIFCIFLHNHNTDPSEGRECYAMPDTVHSHSCTAHRGSVQNRLYMYYTT